MKLFIYEHCPFCVRAEMIFGLKKIEFDRVVVDEDDYETPEKMIGKKMLPILKTDEGRYLPESLDIVQYVDQLEEPILTDLRNEALVAWQNENQSLIFRLAVPRFTKGQFKELESPSARAHYLKREINAFGDLDKLIADSPEMVTEMDAALLKLSGLVATRATTTYGIDDITLYPLLRSLSIVKGLTFPKDVLGYMHRLEAAGGVPLLFDQQL